MSRSLPKPSLPEPDPYRSPTDLQKTSGIHANSIKAWVESGELPAILQTKSPNPTRRKFGIRLSDWEAFLRSREVVQKPNGKRRKKSPKKAGDVVFYA